MRAFEFLIEYNTKGRVKGSKNLIYQDGGKPDWYEKAVKLKTDNPRMSAQEISRQLGVSGNFVLRWLTGVSDNQDRISNDNPPFTIKDFPNQSGRKYFDGAKPWWYEEAIKLRKQGMMYKDIANKLSTPEESISKYTIRNWLLKGKKRESGNLVNPDAPFEPRPHNTKKIDTALLKELIVDKYTDEQIIELIADEKGDKIANQVRAMLPKLRQALQPGTEVRNKVTGDDITGFVQ